MNKGVEVAETFTGLDVGYAVIMKRGVLVAVVVAVLDKEGYGTI